MKSVTEWYSKQPDGSWKYNHLEDGWSTQTAPTPRFESQRRSWAGKEWMHVHQYLDDSNTIVPTERRFREAVMDERKAFEDWAAGEGLQLRREDSAEGRDYFYEITDTAWRAWCAKASSSG